MTLALPSLLAASLPGNDPFLPVVARLLKKLEDANGYYDKYDRYYSGEQPMAFLAPEVEAQVGERFSPLVINWPETITDSVNRRLKAEGFLLGSSAEADDDLWRIWTANEMQHEAPMGQIDMLVHGKAFISVWGNDEDPETPLMAFESAHQVEVEYQPGTGDRVVSAAVKRWADLDGNTYVTLFLPDQVRRYAEDVRPPMTRGGLRLLGVQPNPLGAVPIVPMVNRGRLLNRSGRSELQSIAPIADGINELATGMMVTSEFYLTPRRYATGIQVPVDGADRERLQAEAAAYWENATKKKTWLAGPGVEFGQFPEADLAGFVSGMNMLTSAMAAIGGLPPDDLGLNQVNPASAEARRAAETVLVLRAEEKQSACGRAYTRAQRLAAAIRDGLPLRALPAQYGRMAVGWKDPATQAIAQEMDAAVKGKESGIYDTEAAQARVGMDPAERSAMKARAEQQAGLATTADVRSRMAMARELVQTDGLTMNAAMAAVGLIQAAAINSGSNGSPAGVAPGA